MSDFKVISVWEQDCHLIVTAEHYHPDASFWFTENYRWQGREGLRHKRSTNARGELLLSDGTVAPTRNNVLGESEAYLPGGTDWQRNAGIHMDNNAVLGVIRTIHGERLLSGWPQGQRDVVQSVSVERLSQEDQDGCSVLTAAFSSLVGLEE